MHDHQRMNQVGGEGYFVYEDSVSTGNTEEHPKELEEEKEGREQVLDHRQVDRLVELFGRVG